MKVWTGGIRVYVHVGWSHQYSPYLELQLAIVTPYTADVGVAYRIRYTTKHHTAMVDFCDGHRVTGSLAAQSRGHRQFWTVTNCDPGRSSKYGAYWSDHPLPWFHSLDVVSVCYIFLLEHMMTSSSLLVMYIIHDCMFTASFQDLSLRGVSGWTKPGTPSSTSWNPHDPYHAYYRHKIVEIQEGVAQEAAATASQPQKVCEVCVCGGGGGGGGGGKEQQAVVPNQLQIRLKKVCMWLWGWKGMDVNKIDTIPILWARPK